MISQSFDTFFLFKFSSPFEDLNQMISFKPTLYQDVQSSQTKDEDLLLKYVHTNPEVRLNLLLNHPQIYGFVYIVNGILTKAFLPKKTVD